MPYYVFKVKQDKTAAILLETFERFPDASKQAKILRTTLVVAENAYIKVIHAAEPSEAERLVLERRTPSSPVEEWEV